MTIQFPIDFTICENFFIEGSKNYIHKRSDGSLISIFEPQDHISLYEIFDERHMEYPLFMTYEEIYEYLLKEPIRQLTSNICLN